MILRLAGSIVLGAAWASAVEVDGLTLPFKTVRLSSGVQEIVAEIKVQEGDAVKKDQVLARLHDEKERAEHERAEQIVQKRDFDAKAASALVADKITSREKALEAEIELKLAKVDVDIAQRKVDEKTIKSPMDGIVVRKLKEEGESVDRVEPMFEIINIDQLYLQFYLDRVVAAGLTPGREVEFCISGEAEKTWKAKVDFISPGADAASGLFRVKLLFDNPGGTIKAGVRVTAKF
jgi:RND family efflux transporter MFP subunit